MTKTTRGISCYLFKPTKDAPNSRLPVLHYHDSLPRPLVEESTVKFLTDNGWEHRVWKSPDFSRHSKMLTIECDLSRARGATSESGTSILIAMNVTVMISPLLCDLVLLLTVFWFEAVIRGSSTLLLGQISDGQGMEVTVNEGDVIVFPAGTAHSSLRSSEDYQYVGVYPEVRLYTCFFIHDRANKS